MGNPSIEASSTSQAAVANGECSRPYDGVIVALRARVRKEKFGVLIGACPRLRCASP
jgi:hypothetical protein